MGRPYKYTKEYVIAAIAGSGGIVSTIAKKMGCDWTTADKYIKRWDETRQAYAEEEETVLDMTEGTILKSIKEGNTQDAKWYLSKKGKKRGYGDQVDVSHTTYDEEGKEVGLKVIFVSGNDRNNDK